MASPYQPLADYLAAQPAETAMVMLTFRELRVLLGQPLPASAWGRSWWRTRARTTPTRAWPTLGWRVAAVNVSGGSEAVTFVRVGSDLSGELLSHPARCGSPLQHSEST
jgi:hypothetical protein